MNLDLFFLDNVILLLILIIIFEIVWLWIDSKNNFSLSLTLVPIAVLVVILFVGVFSDTQKLEADLNDFCLSEGYSDSIDAVYCLNEEGKFLVKQRVERVNNNWFFVKDGVGE